jgi:HK97 family phage major capsid protein
MAHLQELREKRGQIAAALQAIVARDDYDPAVHSVEYDKGIEELNAVDEQINRINDLNARLAEDTGRLGLGEAAARRARDQRDPGMAVYAKWLQGGDRALNEDDWATIRNTMSTTTGSEGGFTVPTEVAGSVIDLLKAYGGMRAVADVIVTESGNPMSFPTSDGTAEVGELIAENTTATDADVVFGTVSLGVFKFSSKVVTVPIELLQDSAVDVEAFVNARLVTRLGRITNQMFTTGTGSGQPNGIITAASVGVTASNGTSQVTTVTYDSLVDLKHSVDPAYREAGGCGFMMSDLSVRQISKIKDGQSRPIFVPGYETGVPGAQLDRLLGYPITINQHMAAMAASARSIAFGDFKTYKIRDAMQVSMFRFTDSAYSKKGQVGFMAWMRSGGNLVDTAAVKVFVNAAS